ncbi:MAG: hypothetical protein DPW11_04070 [bacterium]|nr:hypothetical protein [Candidatus Microgenomates bacterium CPR3]MCQ3944924.1 hypothetical protein [bacterium]RIK51959.1 MAG: hypothetical protein DCC61_01050 [Candidatus Microgenomates bacterium]
MFKKLITPIQLWLLSRGQCVGCGMPLAKANSVKHSESTNKITCSCGRIFIYDTQKRSYRRALFSEI